MEPQAFELSNKLRDLEGEVSALSLELGRLDLLRELAANLCNALPENWAREYLPDTARVELALLRRAVRATEQNDL